LQVDVLRKSLEAEQQRFQDLRGELSAKSDELQRIEEDLKVAQERLALGEQALFYQREIIEKKSNKLDQAKYDLETECLQVASFSSLVERSEEELRCLTHDLNDMRCTRGKIERELERQQQAFADVSQKLQLAEEHNQNLEEAVANWQLYGEHLAESLDVTSSELQIEITEDLSKQDLLDTLTKQLECIRDERERLEEAASWMEQRLQDKRQAYVAARVKYEVANEGVELRQSQIKLLRSKIACKRAHVLSLRSCIDELRDTMEDLTAKQDAVVQARSRSLNEQTEIHRKILEVQSQMLGIHHELENVRDDSSQIKAKLSKAIWKFEESDQDLKRTLWLLEEENKNWLVRKIWGWTMQVV